MNFRTDGMKKRFRNNRKLARKQINIMDLIGNISANIPPVMNAIGERAITTVPTSPITLPIILSGTTDWIDDNMNTFTTDSAKPAINSSAIIK